jgi:hypothetical protein
MKYLLYQFKHSGRNRDWDEFRREAASLELPAGAEWLSDNVCLFPCDDVFSLRLARAARRHAIPARCLSITHTGAWQDT